jgi:hypothetical protein
VSVWGSGFCSVTVSVWGLGFSSVTVSVWGLGFSSVTVRVSVSKYMHIQYMHIHISQPLNPNCRGTSKRTACEHITDTHTHTHTHTQNARAHTHARTHTHTHTHKHTNIHTQTHYTSCLLCRSKSLSPPSFTSSRTLPFLLPFLLPPSGQVAIPPDRWYRHLSAYTHTRTHTHTHTHTHFDITRSTLKKLLAVCVYM